jgi:hypothetical protein
VALLFLTWRRLKREGPRDPPFQIPTTARTGHDALADEDDDDAESGFRRPMPGGAPQQSDTEGPFADTNRFSDYSGSAPAPAPAGRPSMDAYGAFSDPAPSGFGGGTRSPTGNASSPGISRTMQYADPYAAVRAQLETGGAGANQGRPPSYDRGY